METTFTEFSKTVRCKDHLTVTIKLLKPVDIPYLVDMLRALPAEEQALLPCDVNDPGYPNLLRKQIDEGSVYRLVAWHGSEEIIGALAMYRGTSHWVSHTARLVQVVHPEYRRSGVATVLLDEVLDLAEELGIRKVYCELTDMHKEACRMVNDIGFQREAVLQDHMRDKGGDFHKLYIYALDVASASLQLTAKMFKYVRMDHRI